MNLYIPGQLYHSLDPSSNFLAFNLKLQLFSKVLLLHQLEPRVRNDGVNLIKTLFQERLVVLYALFKLVLNNFNYSSCLIIYVKVVFYYLYL